ncbi:MAG TPA: hypothetical protein DCY35_07840 [Prolixibacteraceae bacterium]|nr:hypothetical protein [Prolixibacteraceae bacterium]
MKHVHVECLPDEYLVNRLGISRRNITHHQGKSRVFHVLSKKSNQIAMVDEDPGSVKTRYENLLTFVEEFEGIRCYTDSSGNRILYLNGKLEDWIISVCRKEGIRPGSFGLTDRPNDLHEIINYRLTSFDRLLAELTSKDSPALNTLQKWLH